ncbi:MAG: hypothetical protein Q4B54_00415 [Coriobacteriales bacterium]|nr:hypothetical protein [Coriobacteriales bacterium]
MGVPTAIPYDLVRVGDCYGLVFELLECKTLSEIVAEDPSRISDVAQKAVETLKELHSIEVPEGKGRGRKPHPWSGDSPHSPDANLCAVDSQRD